MSAQGDDGIERVTDLFVEVLLALAIDVHNDVDLYAAIETVRQLVASHHDRMAQRREQMRRAVEQGVPFRVVIQQDNALDWVLRHAMAASLTPDDNARSRVLAELHAQVAGHRCTAADDQDVK